MGDTFNFQPGSQYVKHLEKQEITFNIEKVETMNVGGGVTAEGLTEKAAETKPEPAPLPEVLATDEAMAIWKKLQEAKMVDEAYQPVGLSNPEKAVLASFISMELWKENRWKPFEEAWSMKSLSSYYSKALNQPKTSQLIEKIKTSL